MPARPLPSQVALAEYLDAALLRLDEVKSQEAREAVYPLYTQIEGLIPDGIEVEIQPTGTWQETDADWIISAANMVDYAARMWADPVIEAPSLKCIAQALRDIVDML